jgi:hypothetical protein
MPKRPVLDARARTAFGAAALVMLGVAFGDHTMLVEQRAAMIVSSIAILAYLARDRW